MSGEKTEKPTEKKREEARREGRVPRSADFTGTAVMLAAGVTLLLTIDTTSSMLRQFLETSVHVAFAGEASVTAHLVRGLMIGARVLAPILAVAFVTAGVVAYLQVGPVAAAKPLVPDGSRLNPADGWRQMMNKDRLVDLAKNVVRLGTMILIALAVYDTALGAVLATQTTSLDVALEVVEAAAYDQTKFLILALIVFAVFDLIWQRHKFTKELMMTKQEVTEEHRQAEGDPQVKAKRKRLHRELLRNAGIAEVRNADAVVVNPTHVAAAIRYRAEEMQAPTVIAHGRGAIAAEIRKIARRHRVPIVRDVKLAHALADLELDEEIPPDLFEAVAEVLHFAYSLRET